MLKTLQWIITSASQQMISHLSWKSILEILVVLGVVAEVEEEDVDVGEEPIVEAELTR